MISFISIIFGWFWNFLIISVTDSLLTWSSDINLILISTTNTARVSEYNSNVSVTSLPSDTFPCRQSCWWKNGFKIFYNCLLSVIFLTLRLLKQFFFTFSNHCNTKISFFVVSLFTFRDFVFRNLLVNLEWVIRAFRTSLVVKEDWLFLKVFYVEGANLFKSPGEIVWNNSNWLASTLFSLSSFRSSVWNCWLEKFLKSRYKYFLGSSF